MISPKQHHDRVRLFVASRGGTDESLVRWLRGSRSVKYHFYLNTARSFSGRFLCGESKVASHAPNQGIYFHATTSIGEWLAQLTVGHP